MRNQRGFTLIEVLVAAAVLGISATALFGLFSTSLFNLRRVEDLHRYELAAQDMMNRMFLLSALPAEAKAEGALDDHGGRWQVNVRPWVPAGPEQKPQDAILRVHVAVIWPGRATQRKIELEALRAVKITDSNYDLQRAIETIIPK